MAKIRNISATRELFLLDRLEIPFTRAVVREKNYYIRKVSKSFFTEGVNFDETDFLNHVKAMQKIIARYTGNISKVFAKETRENIKQQLIDLEKKEEEETPESQWQLWLLSVIALWDKTHVPRAAQETAATTRRDIKRVVERKLETTPDLSPEQLRKQVLVTRGLSLHRAKTIARTEAHVAARHTASKAAFRMSDTISKPMFKKWKYIHDGLARAAHRAMWFAPAIPLNQYYLVGGETLFYPGDPEGSPANIINCRCSEEYRVDRNKPL